MKLTSQKRILVPGLSWLLDLLFLPVALLLFLLRYLFGIRFWRVRNSRLGPLAGTDLFLRRQKLGIIPSPGRYDVGIANTKTANRQFLAMLKRKMRIISILQPTPLRLLLKIMACRSLLSRWKLFNELGFKGNEYYELNAVPTDLPFLPEEEEKGRALLQTMGVRGWFICFHARDRAYLDHLLQKRDQRHDFRNCSIENYLPATEYLAQQGGYALRMGSLVEKPLTIRLPQIIDYATTFRSDFGDVYLLAKSKFCVINTSGLNSVPYVFGVPVVSANVIPLTRGPPPGKNDLFIPKKIWSVKEKRHLTFTEMIYSPTIERWQFQEFREEDGLVPIENSAQEILEVTIEMNERLDGTWKTTAEDEKLQEKFRSLFSPATHCYGFPSRIGAQFLRENRQLLT